MDISVTLSGIAMGAGFGFVLHLISTLAISSVVSMASIVVGSWSMFYLVLPAFHEKVRREVKSPFGWNAMPGEYMGDIAKYINVQDDVFKEEYPCGFPLSADVLQEYDRGKKPPNQRR